jgi:hypothetical protein
VDKIRTSLPDATYTDWDRFRTPLKKAIAHPPLNPVAPPAMMDRYATTPLVKKLGLKPNTRVALLNAPDDFERTLGDLPEGVTLVDGSAAAARFPVVRAATRDLEAGIGRMSSPSRGRCLDHLPETNLRSSPT